MLACPKICYLNNINHNINNYKIHGLLSCSDWNNSLFTWIYILLSPNVFFKYYIYAAMCICASHFLCRKRMLMWMCTLMMTVLDGKGNVQFYNRTRSTATCRYAAVLKKEMAIQRQRMFMFIFFWCKLLAAVYLSYINIAFQYYLWILEGANTITEVTQVDKFYLHFQFELLLRSSPLAR